MSVQVAMLMGDNADRMANALELIAEAQASNITEITDFYKIDRIALAFFLLSQRPSTL